MRVAGSPRRLLTATRVSRSLHNHPKRTFTSTNTIRAWSSMGLTVDDLNPALAKVEYAVRGELAIKAESYRVQLQDGKGDVPFDRVISSNIGNPQQKGLDQSPLTFPRQV